MGFWGFGVVVVAVGELFVVVGSVSLVIAVDVIVASVVVVGNVSYSVFSVVITDDSVDVVVL